MGADTATRNAEAASKVASGIRLATWALVLVMLELAVATALAGRRPASMGVAGSRSVRVRRPGRRCRGLSYRICPHDGERPYNLRWWLRGYVAGRRPAGLPMPGDEDEL